MELTVTTQTASICSGSAFTVTPAGVPAGTTYTWTAPAIAPTAGAITGGGAQATGQTSISQTLTNTTAAVATATYTVTATSGTCSSTFSVIVTVNPIPSAPTAANPAPKCYSGTAVTFGLTASGCTGGTLKWYTVPTGGTSVASGSPYIVNISATTIYYVSCTIGTCEGPRTTVTATVNNAPVIGNQNVTICSGTAFTVNPAGAPVGTTYTWTAPAIAPTAGAITGGSAQATGQTSISQTLTNTTAASASS